MKTIQITILAEDIRTSEYTCASDCAITKALKKFIPRAKHTGYWIELENGGVIDSPKDLNDKVKSMYRGANRLNTFDIEPLEPQDFTYDLEVPDNWIE